MNLNILSYNFHRHYANFNERKFALNKLLNTYDFDILCAQEYIASNNRIFEKLQSDFDYIATYMNPIFYKKDKFTLIDYTTGKHNKFVAVKLRHENQIICVCNLHLNYGYYKINESRRIKQLTEYLNILKEFNKENYPTIITGDFNCLPIASTLKLINDYENTYRSGSLKECSYNDYSDYDNGEIIDHTFVKGFDILGYKIVTDKFDGMIPSDHYPIYSNLKLKDLS